MSRLRTHTHRILLAALLVILASLSAQSFPAVQASITWSNSGSPLQAAMSSNLHPSALQARDGTLWLAWDSDRYNTTTGRRDIIYTTRTGTVWAPPANFTTAGGDTYPALAQLVNGTVLLFWSMNMTASNNLAYYNLVFKRYNPDLWAPPIFRLTSGTINDEHASAAVGSDGTLWLVWARRTSSCTNCTIARQLYYKTMVGGVWSPDLQLTFDTTNWNSDPSVTVAKDGRVWVFFDKAAVQSTSPQVYYKIFSGGTWGPDTLVPMIHTTSWKADAQPSIMQDRNGTLWLFWAKKTISSNGINLEYDIYNQFSTDNGVTWSTDAQMTFPPPTRIFQSLQPAAVQSNTDKSIWVMYSSNSAAIGEYDIWALQSSPIAPIHDVDLASVTASPGLGSSWTITVKVMNPGDFNETVSVSLILYDSTVYSFGPAQTLVLAAGSTNLVFNWNTGSIPTGLYRARATVTPAPGESLPNQADNALRTGILIQVTTVVPPTGPVGGHVSFHV